MTTVKVTAAKGAAVCFQHSDVAISEKDPVAVNLTSYYRRLIREGVLVDVDGVLSDEPIVVDTPPADPVIETAVEVDGVEPAKRGKRK